MCIVYMHVRQVDLVGLLGFGSGIFIGGAFKNSVRASFVEAEYITCDNSKAHYSACIGTVHRNIILREVKRSTSSDVNKSVPY